MMNCTFNWWLFGSAILVVLSIEACIAVLVLAVPAQAWEPDPMTTYGDGTAYGSSTTYPSYTVPGYQPLASPFDPVVPPAVTIQPQPRLDSFRTPGQPINPFATRR